jgi:hypothetical protein
MLDCQAAGVREGRGSFIALGIFFPCWIFTDTSHITVTQLKLANIFLPIWVTLAPLKRRETSSRLQRATLLETVIFTHTLSQLQRSEGFGVKITPGGQWSTTPCRHLK